MQLFGTVVPPNNPSRRSKRGDVFQIIIYIFQIASCGEGNTFMLKKSTFFKLVLDKRTKKKKESLHCL